MRWWQEVLFALFIGAVAFWAVAAVEWFFFRDYYVW